MKAILIDDEGSSRKTLSWLLETYCPEVEVIGEASSVETGLKVLGEVTPDVLFLDIDLTTGTGFDLLEKIGNPVFDIVFVTAFNEYATKAFEYAATHYLLKPVNPEKLKEAVSRVNGNSREGMSKDQLDLLLSHLRNDKNKTKKLMVPTQQGFELLNTDEIIYCESDGAYTRIILNDRKLIASKTLREFEKLLAALSFFRIHRSHLVNMQHIVKYTRGRGGFVTMSTGVELEVSRQKKDELLEKLV